VDFRFHGYNVDEIVHRERAVALEPAAMICEGTYNSTQSDSEEQVEPTIVIELGPEYDSLSQDSQGSAHPVRLPFGNPHDPRGEQESHRLSRFLAL